jgi:Tfp pilus assembly protein PilP
MKRTSLIASAFAAVVLSGGIVLTVDAQSTTATTTTSSTAAPAATTTAPASTDSSLDAASIQQNLEGVLEAPVSENEYHYDPQGRRDPFRSLIGSKDIAGRGSQGIGGFLVEEIDLQGVVRTKQGLVGMVTGPDNNGYLLRVGDRVFDGEVVRVTPTAVVFRQETREIVKELTSQAERRR